MLLLVMLDVRTLDAMEPPSPNRIPTGWKDVNSHSVAPTVVAVIITIIIVVADATVKVKVYQKRNINWGWVAVGVLLWHKVKRGATMA